MVECEPANRTSIRAFYVYGYVLITAEGTLPSPGYSIDISRMPIRIWPPQFGVVQCPRPGSWPQVLTPYRYSELFRIGGRPDEITVHHAGGSDEVRVEDVIDELEPLARAVGGDAASQRPEGEDETTGFSKRLSFDEAFANAVNNLPPIGDPHPDQLETITVVDMGALFGGIAGFHDLWVRIRRAHD